MVHSSGLVEAMREMMPMTATTASRMYQIITLLFGFALWFAELLRPSYPKKSGRNLFLYEMASRSFSLRRSWRRLLECLPSLQHDPNRPEDVLKVDADKGGDGGDDTADGLRYLVATK